MARPGTIGQLLGVDRNQRVSPTETIGDIGVQLLSGYVSLPDEDSSLQGETRYKTYSQLLANVSIVASATRYFLNLVAKADWNFEPAEADTSGEWAEIAEKMLTDDPDTSWHRVVRRAATYRFYGFGVQEWTAGRDEENGRLTFADIAPRAQSTIDRWDVDSETGRVVGIVQRSPNTFTDIYLPRAKCLYVVDDTLNDSPEGLGLFRHVVKASKELQVLEKLENWGYETDLRGFPIGRAPLKELNDRVEAGTLSAAARDSIINGVSQFIQKHIKTQANNGLLLDSITYETSDERRAPSSQYKFDVELLQGTGSSAHEAIHNTIVRKTHEIARVLSGESLLLGSDGTGSLALSKQKTENLSLVIDSTLNEVGEQVKTDLVDVAWALNNFPEEMKPTPRAESVQFKDVEAMASMLRDMATAGAVLDPEDPVVQEVRSLAGLQSPVLVSTMALDSDLSGGPEGGTVEDDEVPERGAEEMEDE